MAEKSWDIKDLVGQAVQVRWETEVDGKKQIQWHSATLAQLLDGGRVEVTFESFEVNGLRIAELDAKIVKPPRKPKKEGKKQGGAKSYADLLKPPPAPKPEAVAAASAPAPPRAPKVSVNAFDAEKFTAFVKDLYPVHAADIFHPTEEQLEAVKTVALVNHFNERPDDRYLGSVEEISRLLKNPAEVYLFNETRYIFYLPTCQEVDRQNGWDVKVNSKATNTEGSYLVFSKDFANVFEVLNREKGERKTHLGPEVNVVALETSLPVEQQPTKSLVERARVAIARWNEYASRPDKKDSALRTIALTEDAVPLLSAAFEKAFEIKTVTVVTPLAAAVLNEELSRTINCFRHQRGYVQWLEKKRAQQHYNNNNNNNNNQKNNGNNGGNGGKRYFKKDNNNNGNGKDGKEGNFKPKYNKDKTTKPAAAPAAQE